MSAKDEMKEVRNWLRGQVRMIDKDPYLSYAHGKVSARIVRWEASEHRVLVCVRSTEVSETSWNSNLCRWVWIHTWGGRDCRFWKWDIWKELNDVVINMRPAKIFQL